MSFTFKPLNVLAIQIMNAHGDLMDLMNALQPNKTKTNRYMNEDDIEVPIKINLSPH